MVQSKANRSARVDFDLAAAMDLSSLLKSLPQEVQRDVLLDMVKEGAKPVVRAIKRFVPVDTGALKESIGVGLRKGKRNSMTAAAYIGPVWESRFKNGKKIKGKGLEDLIGSEQPARYAHNVEFGHVNRDGTTTEAKPFMRPGTEASQVDCAAMKVVGFQKGLTKALAKLNKRNIRALK